MVGVIVGLSLRLLLAPPLSFVDRSPPDGVRVIAVVRPDLPYSVASLWVRVGSKDDPFGQEGTAHLLEHLIPLTRYGDQTIQMVVEQMGGQIIAETGRDFMAFHLIAPEFVLPKAFPLLIYAVCSPPFDPKLLERERKLALLEMIGRYEDPMWLGRMLMEARLFSGTPYASPPGGWLESLERVTLKSLQDFHRHHFMASEKALIAIITSPQTLTELEQEVAQVFKASKVTVKPSPSFRPIPSITVSVSKGETLWAIGWKVPIGAERVKAWRVWVAFFQNILAFHSLKTAAVTEWAIHSEPIRGFVALTLLARTKSSAPFLLQSIQETVQGLAETKGRTFERVWEFLRHRLALRHRVDIVDPLKLARRIGWAWALYDAPSLPLKLSERLNRVTVTEGQKFARFLSERPPAILSWR